MVFRVAKADGLPLVELEKFVEITSPEYFGSGKLVGHLSEKWMLGKAIDMYFCLICSLVIPAKDSFSWRGSGAFTCVNPASEHVNHKANSRVVKTIALRKRVTLLFQLGDQKLLD